MHGQGELISSKSIQTHTTSCCGVITTLTHFHKNIYEMFRQDYNTQHTYIPTQVH